MEQRLSSLFWVNIIAASLNVVYIIITHHWFLLFLLFGQVWVTKILWGEMHLPLPIWAKKYFEEKDDKTSY